MYNVLLIILWESIVVWYQEYFDVWSSALTSLENIEREVTSLNTNTGREDQNNTNTGRGDQNNINTGRLFKELENVEIQ